MLSYTLDIIEKHNIKATFFVTHETKLLVRMWNNPNIELGIHPNFNPLLNGDFRYGKNFEEVIEYYKNIVPEAVGVRSHSMTQNSPILDTFEKFGLIYDCNTFTGEIQKFWQIKKKMRNNVKQPCIRKEKFLRRQWI